MARAQSSFVHPSAWVDAPCEIGPGCTIWHFSHLMPHCRLGPGCSLGQGVFVAGGVRLGARVRVQSHVSLFAGVEVGDDVFLGPSCVVTYERAPRAARPQHGHDVATRLHDGCTVGAHATIVCGSDVGAHAFVAAGAVLTRPAPAFALMQGVPARRVGWVGHAGRRLLATGPGAWRCPVTGADYHEAAGTLAPRLGPAPAPATAAAAAAPAA